MGQHDRRPPRRELINHAEEITPHEMSVSISPEMVEGLKGELDKFITRFGRAPVASDPPVYDANGPGPNPAPYHPPDDLKEETARILLKAGQPPRCVYAFLQTGMMVTGENLSSFSDDDRFAWRQALRQWDRGDVRGFLPPSLKDLLPR